MMTMGLVWARPWLLLVGVTCAFLALRSFRRAKRPLTGLRWWVALALRLVLIVLLTLVVAGAKFDVPSSKLCLLVCADTSDSVARSELALALTALGEAWDEGHRRGDIISLLAFSDTAQLDSVPAERLPPGLPSRVGKGSSSDIACALRLASATAPEGWGRRILVVSDGNENRGRALEEAAALARQGVEVWALPVGRTGSREIIVERVDVPQRIRPGDPYQVSVVLESDHAGTGKLKLFENEHLVAEESVSYKAGRSVVRFGCRAEQTGLSVFRAELSAPSETGLTANNRGEAFCFTSGRERVLYLHGRHGAPSLVIPLLHEGSFDIENRSAERCPHRLIELSNYAAIVLDGVSAPTLGKRRMECLESYVRDTGGGLIVLGGPQSFGAGGYYQTALERALPVTMDVKNKRTRKRSALAVVVDVSGSMGLEEAGVTKLELANEGTARACELLDEGSLFGLCAVDTATSWVVPMTQVSGPRGRMVEQILKLRPGGGGIYVYTGLAAAYAELEGIEASVRHVILFADTADSEEPIGPTNVHVHELAKRMAAKEITTSVVGIGHRGDRDIALLRGLALRGNGRFYFTEDMFSIPALFAQEAMLAARNVVIEEPVEPVFVDRSPLLAGIAAVPGLSGYVATSARSRSTVALAGLRDEPLLAHWHYGAGRAVAFTSSMAQWGEQWTAWPNVGRLWLQTLRWAMRGRGNKGAKVVLRRDGELVDMVVEVRGAKGAFEKLDDVAVHLSGPSGSSEQSVVLEQVAPGRYRARFHVDCAGTYVVNVAGRLGDGTAVNNLGALSVAYSPEYERLGPNHEVLGRMTSLTGGHVIGIDDVAACLVPPRELTSTLRSIAPWLLLLALWLWLVDAASRRRNIGLRTIRSWFTPRVEREGSEQGAGEAVGAALSRIRHIREREGPVDFERELAPAAPHERQEPASDATPPEPKPVDDTMARLLEAKRRARRDE